MKYNNKIHNNNLIVADIFCNLGLLFKDLSKPDKSNLYLNESLQVYLFCHGNEDDLDVAKIYNYLGLLSKDKSE